MGILSKSYANHGDKVFNCEFEGEIVGIDGNGAILTVTTGGKFEEWSLWETNPPGADEWSWETNDREIAHLAHLANNAQLALNRARVAEAESAKIREELTAARIAEGAAKMRITDCESKTSALETKIMRHERELAQMVDEKTATLRSMVETLTAENAALKAQVETPKTEIIEMKRVVGVDECAKWRNAGWQIVHTQFVDIVPYFVMERTASVAEQSAPAEVSVSLSPAIENHLATLTGDFVAETVAAQLKQLPVIVQTAAPTLVVMGAELTQAHEDFAAAIKNRDAEAMREAGNRRAMLTAHNAIAERRGA